MEPSKDEKLEIFRKMSLLKQSDDKARSVMRSGRLLMPYYSYRGQEVIPSTIMTILNDEDYICTIYRGLHDSLAKGLPLKLLWAELAGRVTGTCKGKGGPMHITYPEKGIMVTTGIVGSTMPIANGLAWASLLSDDKRVTVAFFGDGASNIGAFHEALNMASLWKLPVIFVCSNNRYAEHTKTADGTAIEKISDRSAAYSMPGIHVDGNDPVAMYAAAREAIDRARAGEGPTLIEAMTFRFFGHIYGDNDAYMDEGERASWMAKDPYEVWRKQLIAEGLATEDELAAIEAAHETEIEEAVQFALASAHPDPEEIYRDVFEKEIAA